MNWKNMQLSKIETSYIAIIIIFIFIIIIAKYLFTVGLDLVKQTNKYQLTKLPSKENKSTKMLLVGTMNCLCHKRCNHR